MEEHLVVLSVEHLAILGLQQKHLANIHGTVVFAYVVTVRENNMDNVAVNAMVQEGYHFNDYISCAITTIKPLSNQDNMNKSINGVTFE